jgi:hypothetical protein
MSNQAKMLRGQVRAEVKELLQEELVKAVEEKLMKVILDRLDKIDKKQKDIQGFMIRSLSLSDAAKK